MCVFNATFLLFVPIVFRLIAIVIVVVLVVIIIVFLKYLFFSIIVLFVLYIGHSISLESLFGAFIVFVAVFHSIRRQQEARKERTASNTSTGNNSSKV